MKNSFGNSISVTVFGESHGSSIGAVIDGIAPGIEVDREYIDTLLSRRRPSGAISTARCEQDQYVIESGVFEGRTTGTPICIRIPNTDTRSRDYAATKDLARPSHADYTAHVKYNGFEDYRGGGHQSGRITAALCAVGGIIMPALEKKGIRIYTRIKRCAGISDAEIGDITKLSALKSSTFPVLDEEAGERMQRAILAAKEKGDSVGGVLETVITGMPAGIGEPFFDSLESVISHAVFAVPAIKGIEFGAGFDIADMLGSEANDPFLVKEDCVVTVGNNSGGINGGISNSMPIVFRCAVRPTPTILKEQQTINMATVEDATILPTGRHDPCIVHRAAVVVECTAAIAVADMLGVHFGTDWLGR